jgi:lipid-binding SYLF domain-containing protein
MSLLATLTLALSSATVLAADKVDEKEKVDKKAAKHAEKKSEIDAMAKKTLHDVLEKSPEAKKLYDKSYGYAAFENLKIALGVSGGGGSGVAVTKAGKRTYMKMGTAGIGLGIGGQKYEVLFLFESQKAFDSFVDKGWQADTSAQASAGDKGANAASTFKDGVAFYQITDKGLMASADIAGTKYWKNDELNGSVTKK